MRIAGTLVQRINNDDDRSRACFREFPQGLQYKYHNLLFRILRRHCRSLILHQRLSNGFSKFVIVNTKLKRNCSNEFPGVPAICFVPGEKERSSENTEVGCLFSNALCCCRFSDAGQAGEEVNQKFRCSKDPLSYVEKEGLPRTFKA